jgi:hypothetical protein
MTRYRMAACLGLILISTSLRAADDAPRRVGSWELGTRPLFAVAAAPSGDNLHFVYVDAGQLRHSQSADGGVTWSAPQFIASGSAPALAVDGRGTVHLVHESDGTTRVEYRRFTRGTWSPARDITTSVPGKPAQALAPRIAVDGAGHVHVIYWTLWKDSDWKPGSRTAYWRKPAGQDDFDAPVLWAHQQEGGNRNARHGALAVDPAGNVHLFYVSNRNNAHALERRVRFQDGTWGRHDHWPGRLRTDWCIGAAVTADGVVHISSQTRVNERLQVIYSNNRSDPAVLALEHDLGWESYETFTHLLAAPDGDLWIATGHIEGKERADFEPPDDLPNIGTFTRYDAATKSWSPRTPLSAPGVINLDARRGNQPQLVMQGGRVRVFYAERVPGEKWRHWQRILGSAAATSSTRSK